MVHPHRAFLLLALVGCGGATPSKFGGIEEHASPSSPLGPSVVLIGRPITEPQMLTLMAVAPIDPSRPLDGQLVPNPCADFLAEAKSSPTLNSFEDAEDLGLGAHAAATLGKFGFEGDASRATHFVYKIDTSKRIARAPTPEYTACCKEKGCGVGYVSTLVYGTGEYSSAAETDLSAHVDLTIASADGSMALKVLHKRTIEGYLAAIVTQVEAKPNERAPVVPSPPVIMTASPSTIASLNESARAAYDQAKLSVCARPDRPTLNGSLQEWSFCDGNKNYLTENEFVRRYQSTSGFHDLDEHKYDREKMFGIGALGFFGLSLIGYGIAIAAPAQLGNGYTNGTPVIGWTAGIGGDVLGIALGLVWLRFHEGDDSSSQYELTEPQARLALGRYNRALARKIVNGEVPSSNARPSAFFTPTFRFTSNGVRGTF